jgi:hypothetical protein
VLPVHRLGHPWAKIDEEDFTVAVSPNDVLALQILVIEQSSLQFDGQLRLCGV